MCLYIFLCSGVDLIESLVRLPSIRVRAWRIEHSPSSSAYSSGSSSESSSSSSSSSSGSSYSFSSSAVDEDQLRQTLLRIRQLAMTNLIVVSSEPVAHAVIEMVRNDLYLPPYICLCLSLCMFVYVSLCCSLCRSLFLSAYLCACASMSVFQCLSLCLRVSISFSLYISVSQ